MKVIDFPTHKVLRDNLPVEKCFKQAGLMNLKEALIIGYTPEGKFFFSASENTTNESSNWLLDLAKKYVFGELE